MASGQDGCKDDASDESQTSDLGVSPDLSISESRDYKKNNSLYHLFINNSIQEYCVA